MKIGTRCARVLIGVLAVRTAADAGQPVDQECQVVILNRRERFQMAYLQKDPSAIAALVLEGAPMNGCGLGYGIARWTLKSAAEAHHTQ